MNHHNYKITLIVFLVLLSIYILIFNIVVISTYSEVDGWSSNTSRRVLDYVTHEKSAYMEPPELCRDPIFLLIIVCSTPSNVDARQSIRESWGNISEFNYPMFEKMHGANKGNYLSINNKEWKTFVESFSNSTRNSLTSSKFRVRVVFLLGVTNEEQQIQTNHEHQFYGDIIQENFIDTYNNLTLKTIFMLKWINDNCLNNMVKYVMKTDDDMFLNLPNLLHILLGGTLPVYQSTIAFYNKFYDALSEENRLENTKDLLMGYKHCSAKPITDVNSKWHSPGYMFSGEYYPEYLSGSAYLMTISTLKQLYVESLNTPLFHLEDAFLTGFVAQKIKHKRHHHPLFRYFPDSDRCSLRGRIVQHLMTPNDLREAYNFVIDSTKVCGVSEKNFSHGKFNLALLRHNLNCFSSEF